MAREIRCDLCAQVQANWLMGNLGSGEQIALCAECLTGWMLTMLDGVLESDQKALVAERWGKPQPEAPAAEARAPRARKRKAATSSLEASSAEPDSRLAEAAATPDDG